MMLSQAGVRRLVAIALLALAWCGEAPAHARSESFSRWNYQDGLLSLRFTVSEREATRLSPPVPGAEPGAELARYLDRRIDAQDRLGTCRRAGEFRPVDARPGYLQATAQWRCDETPARLAVRAFLDHAPEHTHFATLETQGTTAQRLLTRERPVWRFATDGDANTSRGAEFTAFVKRGFRHILSGPDHVLFLLVLLIACRRASGVFWAVTGFTAGHSLTLGLAATGVIESNLPAVEATIGLTIALVAVERAARGARDAVLLSTVSAALLLLLVPVSAWLNGLAPGLLTALALFAFCYLMLAQRSADNGAFKVLVTTLFGLVHGLGFASAFLASGVAPARLLWPLAGFNIGVELGQLAVVGLMGAAALALRRRPRLAGLSADLAAAAGCAVGLYWFLERGFP
jgi:hypothetical protein